MKKITQQMKITFYFFVFSLGLIVTFIYIDMKFFSNQVQKTAMANAIEKIQQQEKRLSFYFEKPKKILHSVNNSNFFSNYLVNNKRYESELNSFFLTIVQINKNIMQFRYIDSTGSEKIRIDRNALGERAVMVAKDKLQSKSNRYYFKDSKTKTQNKVWFSDLDLNMEHGKVIEPIIPTLRAILPIRRHGEFDGVLIINYFMKDLLSTLNSSTLFDMILLNEQGHILKHYEKNKSWTMYDPNRKTTFINSFPMDYDKILSNSLYINDRFISKRMPFNTPNKLIYLLEFKKDYIQKSQEEKIQQYFVVSSIIIFLSLIMSYIFSKNFKRIFFLLKDSEKLNKLLGSEVDQKTKQLEELNKNLEKRIEEEILKNKQKDEEIFSQAKHVAMGEMLANIAHQWRQPLSLISTNASGVKLRHLYKQLDYKELPSHMDLIIDKTQYLSSTIDTFRDLLTEDKEHKQIILQESIGNALNIMSGALEANYININNNIESNKLVTLNTIGSQLTEVLINIITNAKDVLLHREIESASISLDLEFFDEFVCIIIEDNAGGINDEHLPRIFEPYFTTKHKSQGTGLGLHMSYRIVTENLNGNIYAKNSESGAKFFIELPLS